MAGSKKPNKKDKDGEKADTEKKNEVKGEKLVVRHIFKLYKLLIFKLKVGESLNYYVN